LHYFPNMWYFICTTIIRSMNTQVNLASQIFITFVVSLLGLLGQKVFFLAKLYIHGFKKCNEWIKKSRLNSVDIYNICILSENITYICVRAWETWKDKTFTNISGLFRRGCKYSLFFYPMWSLLHYIYTILHSIDYQSPN
jgi:hypothetical protein